MHARPLALLIWLFLAAPATAEMVEVAPGVSITRKSFDAPINEQPFFGFAAEVGGNETDRRRLS